LINATWLNLTDETFQCKRTEALYQNRRDADVVIKMNRITKGCGVFTDSPKVEVGQIGFHSCLCHESFQHPKMGFFLGIYQNYEKGLLPFSGALMDQPAQTMELITLLSNLHTERDIAQQKKDSQNSKKGNK
jgi:ubiquinone/menaquinone biosynthesis C-methylase UbiE